MVFGFWYLVLGEALRPSADWDWVGVAEPRTGHARATREPRARHARATRGCRSGVGFVLRQKKKGGGVGQSARHLGEGAALSPQVIADIGEPQNLHKHDDTDQGLSPGLNRAPLES